MNNHNCIPLYLWKSTASSSKMSPWWPFYTEFLQWPYKRKCNSSDGTQLHLTKPSPKYLRCTWILFHCSDLSRVMPSIKSLTNITHHTSWTHKHQHIEFLGGNIDVFPRFPNLTSGIIVLKRVLPTTLSTGKLPYSMLLLLIYLIFHLLSRGICTSSKF